MAYHAGNHQGCPSVGPPGGPLQMSEGIRSRAGLGGPRGLVLPCSSVSMQTGGETEAQSEAGLASGTTL